MAEADLGVAALALARRIAAKGPLSFAIGKEAFYRQVKVDRAAVYGYASAVLTRNMLACDATESIDAFPADRQPQWSGT